jgi:hypothetical protein
MPCQWKSNKNLLKEGIKHEVHAKHETHLQNLWAHGLHLLLSWSSAWQTMQLSGPSLNVLES